MVLIPNCSESVLRFHTTDPKEIRTILQALANEIDANTSFEVHQKQTVPEYETAEEYDTGYTKDTEITSKDIHAVYDEQRKGNMTKDEAQAKASQMMNKMEKEKYPNNILYCCAGLGDNECNVSVNKEKGYFDLNIGNNDISPNTTDWIETVMNICRCEEAEGSTEGSEELAVKARDCTCGVSYFE